MKTLTLISTRVRSCVDLCAPYMVPGVRVTHICFPDPCGQQVDMIEQASHIAYVVPNGSNVQHVATMLSFTSMRGKPYGLFIEPEVWCELRRTEIWSKPSMREPHFVVHPTMSDERPAEVRTAGMRALLAQ